MRRNRALLDPVASDLPSFDGLIGDRFVSVSCQVGEPGWPLCRLALKLNAEACPSEMNFAVDVKPQTKVAVAHVVPRGVAGGVADRSVVAYFKRH